jgi:hypothetical protein
MRFRIQPIERLNAMQTTSMGPRGFVIARGVAAMRVVAGKNMRLTVAISRTHQPVPESHLLIRNGSFPRSLLLQLRTPIPVLARRRLEQD